MHDRLTVTRGSDLDVSIASEFGRIGSGGYREIESLGLHDWSLWAWHDLWRCLRRA